MYHSARATYIRPTRKHLSFDKRSSLFVAALATKKETFYNIGLGGHKEDVEQVFLHKSCHKVKKKPDIVYKTFDSCN